MYIHDLTMSRYIHAYTLCLHVYCSEKVSVHSTCMAYTFKEPLVYTRLYISESRNLQTCDMSVVPPLPPTRAQLEKPIENDAFSAKLKFHI